MTIEQAKNLRYGQVITHTERKNADGTPLRAKVNGKPKTWKTRPDAVQIPVKRGLYEFGYVGTESGNSHLGYWNV